MEHEHHKISCKIKTELGQITQLMQKTIPKDEQQQPKIEH